MSRRRRGEPHREIVLPITPMLDMAFQLLFFFIANFNPSDLEGKLDLGLPSEDVKAAHKKEDIDKVAKPAPDMLEFPSDLTVTIRAVQEGASEGSISSIFVRNTEGKETAIAKAPLSDKDLEYLEKRVRPRLVPTEPPHERARGQREYEIYRSEYPYLKGLHVYLTEASKVVSTKDAIKVQGVNKLRVRSMLRVMDACRKAGFVKVSYVTPEDYESN